MASKLRDICSYAKGKISVAELTTQTYISTENMLPNKGGITVATNLPSLEQTQAYRKNDVLVSNIRPYFKKIWHAEYDGGCSNDVLVFRAAEGIDPAFLYCVLADDAFFNYSMATSKGTKMPRGDKGAIMEYRVPDFDIETQRKIGKTLRSIDEKIAVNSKINDNLQQQAQAVLSHYMETFSYELRPLANFANVIDCLHSKKPDKVDDSTCQLIQLDNIRDDGFLDLAACKYMISQSDYDNWTRKCEIIEGDCVITNVGRIGAVSQAPFGTHAAMGRNMTCMRLKNSFDLRYYFITVLLSRHMRLQIMSNTDEGTIMGALNVKNIPKLLFPFFETSTMQELENTLKPIRKQIEYLNLMNQNLASLRDTLLPKLMTGELDVSFARS